MRIDKFKIPTLLGLALILVGIITGLILVMRNQIFLSHAAPDLTPQNVTVSNITDTDAVISWETSQPISSFVTLNSSGGTQLTALEDQDNLKPTPHALHYVTVKNLQPSTDYTFTITSGASTNQPQIFKTAKAASFQNGFGPIRGTILDGQTPLDAGIVYLSIQGAVTQSARLTDSGNFIIPISVMRKTDLSDTFQPGQNDTAKLTVISNKGNANALFKINPEGVQLTPISLGQNTDLTAVPSATPTSAELQKFDLNGDGKINSLDYSELILNFGKNPKNPKADLDGDGIVDQKDLQLMSKEINKFSTQ